ncbi:hypothetical protein PQX77_002374 [Marasmius sp. AFHP31]|nr:hypothetical protein PQX77_002374 [Marasmius sp. AFHP31]
MPNVCTVDDHFCNLLYKLYKHWPYHEDYSAKLTNRSLIPCILLDLEREALPPIYFYEDNLSEYIPLKSQNVIDMVAKAIARLKPKQLIFFQYDPLMAHWVTHPSYYDNPILHEEFYLDELNQPDSPSVWDYQCDDSKLDEYFGWDEVAVLS